MTPLETKLTDALLANAKLREQGERLIAADERVGRLLATIPIEVQQEGLSLSSPQASLRGRWRGNCHPGELAAALRRRGFERKRNWRSNAGGFRATWRKTS
jgi:hypothetical protein